MKRKFSRIRIFQILLTVFIIVAGFFVYVNLGGSLCGCASQADVAGAFVKIGIPNPLEAYRKDTGNYPTTAQGLQALITAPSSVNNWHGPYLTINFVPKDPWGNEYQYICPGVHNPKGYDVWSWGRTGPGKEDTIMIGNW